MKRSHVSESNPPPNPPQSPSSTRHPTIPPSPAASIKLLPPDEAPMSAHTPIAMVDEDRADASGPMLAPHSPIADPISGRPCACTSREPVITAEGEVEWYVDCIVDEERRVPEGEKRKCLMYLVRWLGYSPNEDSWVKAVDMEECEALDKWLDREL
ncbi:hypothetical protein D9611_001330 [Ephemerocybe angulata]|uniref:Chromo domain-containing protein n=1 Tax=Ephemerocybe angulata TaxID=980116 RepID=A0A8H5FLZ4_9AGAR|nr:hypothetical protein D9611_001330 [Tulosesus angulatus]